MQNNNKRGRSEPKYLHKQDSSATAPRQLLLHCSTTCHPWQYALLSVSVPDSTLPIPSLESYHLRPCRRRRPGQIKGSQIKGSDSMICACNVNHNFKVSDPMFPSKSIPKVFKPVGSPLNGTFFLVI